MKQYIIIFCTLFCFTKVYSCTIIIGYKNGKVLVGNNEDWYKSNAKYWFEKPKKKKDKYTAYFFGFEGDGKFAQGGMNEVGLMFDGTYVSKIKIDRDNMREHKLKAAPVHLFKNILKQCGTIEEAEVIINKYFIPYIRKAQVLIADANGGYLIIKGNGVSEKGYLNDGEYKVITNFHLEELQNNSYTCYRYDLANQFLNKHFENSTKEFEDLLYRTHQNYPAATVYSNIYDLKNLSSTLYYNANFNKKITINFSKNQNTTPIFLEKELFKKRIIGELIKIYKKNGISHAKHFYEKESKNALTKYEVNVQQLIDLGEYLFNQNKNKDYINLINYIITSLPKSDKKQVALGKLNLRQGKIENALKSFKEAIKINQSSFWAAKLIKQYSNSEKCNYEIELEGYENAKVVMLYGSFNEWRGYDNVCYKKDGKWVTCIKSKPGKYQYRFKVDGKWVEHINNPTSQKLENGFRVSTFTIDKNL